MTDVFICDYIRTPIGRFGGSLSSVRTDDLAAIPLRALMNRHAALDWAAVDDVIMGCANQAGEDNRNVARMAALLAGLPQEVPGTTMNRLCASGADAIAYGARAIKAGEADLIIAGGVESMSRVPIGSDGGAWAMDPETNSKTLFVPQGIGADLIATMEGFSREDVDAYALESQKRATAARAEGRFARSVVPVTDWLGQTLLEEDEFIKPRTTMEGLASLKPAFDQMGAMGFDAVALQRYPQVERIQHVHHAGNSSGIVDGAAALLIGNEAAARNHDLQPRARIVAVALSGADPTIMLTGPMPAARKALAKAGLGIDQIDLFEVNEAFAAVPMKFMKEMGVPHEKVNVNGGAIAMGHPLGATGAMILNTLIDELHRRQLRYGLATLCVGGGMGIATIVERI